MGRSRDSSQGEQQKYMDYLMHLMTLGEIVLGLKSAESLLISGEKKGCSN